MFGFGRVPRVGRSRGVVVTVSTVVVLALAFGGVAWASSVKKGKRVDVSATYTIRVAAGESKEQQLFTVGDVVVATECAAWWDAPGVFMVGGKAGTVTNHGSDDVLLVIGERGAEAVAPGSPVQVLPPDDSEAFLNVGGAATNNDSGGGGLMPFAILDEGEVSATGALSVWYDAPADPIADPFGTCVVSAYMKG